MSSMLSWCMAGGGVSIGLEQLQWLQSVLCLKMQCTDCLHVQGQGILSLRCMLPLIDLCNHAGTASNCCLTMRLAPCGQPRCFVLFPAC